MMTDNNSQDQLKVLRQVEELGEEVKNLAINIAIYLAKSKTNSDVINQMEPEFIRLVNGTVKVVHELTNIINAARNMEKMVYELPSDSNLKDHLEIKLKDIVKQCNQILWSLNEKTDKKDITA